jgi:hypothetical protein
MQHLYLSSDDRFQRFLLPEWALENESLQPLKQVY